MKYLRWIWKTCVHKFHVARYGLKIGCPLWRLITHDMSKFLPSEFIPHARWFCGGWKEKKQYLDWDKEIKVPIEQTLNPKAPKIREGHIILPRKLVNGTAVRWHDLAGIEKAQDALDRAWHHHLERNPHHPEHWVLRNGEVLEMPMEYRLEMLADWISRAKHRDKMSLSEWYETHGKKLPFAPLTRKWVEGKVRELA